MNKVLYVAPFAIIAVTVLIALFTILPRVDRSLTIRAIEVCAKSTQFVQENSEKAYKSQYPIQELYKVCLDQTK
jgi:hypothetical protein